MSTAPSHPSPDPLPAAGGGGGRAVVMYDNESAAVSESDPSEAENQATSNVAAEDNAVGEGQPTEVSPLQPTVLGATEHLTTTNISALTTMTSGLQHVTFEILILAEFLKAKGFQLPKNYLIENHFADSTATAAIEGNSTSLDITKVKHETGENAELETSAGNGTGDDVDGEDSAVLVDSCAEEGSGVNAHADTTDSNNSSGEGPNTTTVTDDVTITAALTSPTTPMISGGRHDNSTAMRFCTRLASNAKWLVKQVYFLLLLASLMGLLLTLIVVVVTVVAMNIITATRARRRSYAHVLAVKERDCARIRRPTIARRF